MYGIEPLAHVQTVQRPVQRHVPAFEYERRDLLTAPHGTVLCKLDDELSLDFGHFGVAAEEEGK
jgi:hypothetical protein